MSDLNSNPDCTHQLNFCLSVVPSDQESEHSGQFPQLWLGVWNSLLRVVARGRRHRTYRVFRSPYSMQINDLHKLRSA